MTAPNLPAEGSSNWTSWGQWVHTQATKVFNKLGIADLSATGTPSATTYLRGDNTWATPPAGGDGTVTSANITDATTVGRSVLTAADAAAARGAIGAGAPVLVLAAGDPVPGGTAAGTVIVRTA